MSCNDWERAEILLPSKEVAGFKAAMASFDNTLHAAVYDLARVMHTQVKTRVQGTYNAEVIRLREQLAAPLYRNNTHQSNPGIKLLAIHLASDVLTGENNWGKSVKLMVLPTHEAIDRYAPRATNKTTSWVVLSDQGSEAARISLNGRTVLWTVASNNHAVDGAHEALGAHAFFGALDKITFTRGSGGFATSNDDFNGDNREDGGGANYRTFHYGPLGEENFGPVRRTMNLVKTSATRPRTYAF